ncbi:DUF502 domain-containing protein [Legionella sp. W05-934-2]|uniref:DUF502 domain-containing protein n=1 Tax=Legionella sp. W05-934-2 TaxID=1198649 RepID=UPI00346243E5
MKFKPLRHYLVTGLIVWLPIIVTLWIFRFVIELLDKTISLLPHAYQPEQLIGFHLPGLGVIVTLLVLSMTGMFATNFLGQRMVRWGESILARIPLVRSIYNAAKQVIEAVFSTNSQAFRKVLLVEYPRKGMWSIAFLTNQSNPYIEDKTGLEMLTIFIPTTPNPTSGFLMAIPKSEATELDMSIDEALKLVISLGVMQNGLPPQNQTVTNPSNP